MPVDISSVLLYLAIFIIAAKSGGYVAIRFRQPSVLGELVAGIIVGPFVAGLVSQQLFGTALYINITAPAGEVVGAMAEIGIILLLFLAGLSIDVDEFKKSEKSASIVAVTGVIAAFLLGFGSAIVFNWTPIQAAFVGAVLAATSVGITVRTLIDVDKLQTKVGMTILGAAVIDDIIGIVLLSVLAGLALGGFTVFGLATNLVVIGIFFLAAGYIGIKLIPRFLSFISKLHVEEITLSATLVIVFLISIVAESSGLAAITGAFVAGLIMSKVPFAKALRAKVTTIGYGFFIPLFFVEMGVRTDIGALAGAGFMAAALVGIAMFDKVVGCGAGALLSGFSLRDSFRVGVGMMPRMEVALVVAAIGIKAGIVTAELLSMTVIVVLVTALVTPPLVKYAFKETQAEKNQKRKT